MKQYNFDRKNFEKRSYDKGLVILYFEKSKELEFSNLLHHNKKKFSGYKDIKMFLLEEENKEIDIFITIKEKSVIPFQKVEGGFLIDIESYMAFQEATKKSNGGRTKAFLTQSINATTISSDIQFTDDQIIGINKKASNSVKEKILVELSKDCPILQKSISIEDFIEKFAQLSQDELNQVIHSESLASLDFVNISFRKAGLKKFKEMIGSKEKDEKKWQSFFQKNTWIFGYGLDYRFMRIFDREMSVGDSGTEDQNKPVVDFLNEYSDFTVLVELKTPETPLFDTSKNRAGCWKISEELTDAYSQVIEQKAEWTIKGSSGKHRSKDGKKEITTRTRDPKAILVIGNKVTQIEDISNLTEKDLKRDTFELFRRDIRNIEIITYDELFERATFIVNN